jgi:hypothetical protein
MAEAANNGRADWQQTASGVAFFPLKPRVEEVRLHDIAHSLALVNRYGGHTPAPYSVAQHSALVLKRVREILAEDLPLPPDERLNIERWALLHDAAEAYVGDMVRPLKIAPQMAAYRDAEKLVMEVIATRFQLKGFEPAVVKRADNDLLATEAGFFFPPRERPMAWNLTGARCGHINVAPLFWVDAELLFKTEFKTLWPEEA